MENILEETPVRAEQCFYLTHTHVFLFLVHGKTDYIFLIQFKDSSSSTEKHIQIFRYFQ